MQDLIARAEKIARLLKHRGESIAVAESAKNQLLRNFRHRSIFDFFNTIRQKRTSCSTSVARETAI